MDKETFVCFEMNQTNGSVTASAPSFDQATAGDIWELSVRKGPPNNPLFRQTDLWNYPPQFQPAGFTDAKGDLDFKSIVSADEASSEVYQVFYMMFPNSVGGFDKSNPGYQDPTCPKLGFRNVAIAIVAIPGASARR